MKRISKICAFLLTAVVAISTLGSHLVFAEDSGNYVTGDTSSRQPIPDCYVFSKAVYNLGAFADPKEKNPNQSFKQPQDLFIDDNDYVYVADTGNNRIVKFNPDLEVVGVFYGPEDKKFNSPQGVFVDRDGDIYVSDTENHRIVHMNGNGQTIEVFTNPESELETGETFSPSKLVITDTGYIYVVRGEHIMTIDGTSAFRGYFGQTNIGFNLLDVLTRMFASEEQKKFAKKRLASSYINIDYGKDGMIYATSMDREEGEIKKLNSVGSNIYRKYKTIGSSFVNPVTALINKAFKSVVAGKSFKFGEYFNDKGMYIEPEFVDICVDEQGIVTVVERLNGKVYQYDQGGRMLVAFGGLGEKKGLFTKPAAIDMDSKGNIYVLDQIQANFQIFEPTEFIQNIHDATSTYNDGDYQASYELWEKVLTTDENYDLAHVGIAKAYYKQGRFKDAMAEAKIVKDRDTYTMAFDEYKYEVLRANFLPIMLLALAIVIAVVLLIRLFAEKAEKGYWKFLKEKDKKMTIGEGIMYAFNTIIHPFDAYEGIKYNRDRINMIVPFILFIMAYVVRIAYLYIIHFPLASMEKEMINPWMELVKLWIVPISWIPATFMATSISGGESKMKEIFFATSTAFTPYIVIMTPLMFLSNIMSKTQASWFGIFEVLATVGMIWLMFAAMMSLNHYTFGKALGMMFVSGFLMLVLWLVLLLCYVLTGRMIQFVIQLFQEFRLNFL